eukprot:TRINITY_DN14150_c1_g1_i2.p1 TRINITY_DN14150_c1_g1~~TRINITY_DN14150_c1_g1_i2.p1  ORF type:complete len:441 (-),score=69.43 TRINITY_DN14150_c1_g1_i2:881-2131(-)
MQRLLAVALMLLASALVAAGGSAQMTLSDLSKVRFIGRWYDSGGGKAHSWTGQFVVRFRGSSSIAVNLWSGLGLYFVCTVDGQPPSRRIHQDGLFSVANGLDASTEHVVKCGRSNEAAYGETVLKTIVLDAGAELLQAPPALSTELKVEVIGDSITAGLVSKWQPGQAMRSSLENCDVFDTYARHLAEGLGTSEWHAESRSGIAVYPYSEREKSMPQQFVCRGYTWAPHACPKEWDFAWQADVVVINLGTNDYVYGRETDEQFVSAYKSFIELVRQKYPNAAIMCVIPLAYSCFSQSESKWVRMRDNIEAAVRQVGSDKVKVYRSGTVASPWLNCATDYMDKVHPTAAGHVKFANKLLEAVTPDLRRLYPEKCSGSGSRFRPPHLRSQRWHRRRLQAPRGRRRSAATRAAVRPTGQ